MRDLSRPSPLAPRPYYVVVGAGISGLALAYRLHQRYPAARVTVLEANAHPGGNFHTAAEGGYLVEFGPNGFLDSKPSTVQLCRDLGLGDRLTAGSEVARTNRYLLLNGALRKLPGGPAGLATSSLLSWRGKLALFREPFRQPRHDASDESVADFFARRIGREATDLFADAMVTGIHAGDPALLSVRSAFPRVAAWERGHGSLFRGIRAAQKTRTGPQRLWSLPGGLGELTTALAAALPEPVRCGVSVDGLERHRGRWLVRAGVQSWPADHVILTCPAPAQARILRDLDPDLANAVAAIRYAAVAVVAVAYAERDVPHRPDGFGFIAPQRFRGDVLGVQWCSSIFPGRAPAGSVLWRTLCGGWNRPDIIAWDDERLLAAVGDVLRQAHGVTGPPRQHWVVRWPQAIPQYHLGHGDRVARIAAMAHAHPGLTLAGNAYRGVAVNDCTEEAARLAAILGPAAEFA